MIVDISQEVVRVRRVVTQWLYQCDGGQYCLSRHRGPDRITVTAFTAAEARSELLAAGWRIASDTYKWRHWCPLCATVAEAAI